MKKIYTCGVMGLALACAAPAFATTTDIVVDPFAAAAVSEPATTTKAATTPSSGDATARDTTTSETSATPERGATDRATATVTPSAKGATTSTAATTSRGLHLGTLNTELPWLRALVAFLFVSSLIFMIASIARRLLHGGKRIGGKRTSFLQLRQVMSLGAKRSIYVFDVDSTRVFVGITGTTMQTLYTTPINDAVTTPVMTTARAAANFVSTPAHESPNIAMATPPIAGDHAVAELRTALLAANDDTPTTASPTALGEQIRAIVRNLRPFNLRTPADGRWTK